MLTVGLTGGIGAGKSAVSGMLADHGATVVDADRVAREVVAPGTPGLTAVVEAFGAQVLGPDGALDRPRLGNLVFSDPEALARLNAITHPRIGERTLQLMAEAAGRYLVHDVPLLVENGLAPAYHLVVVVDAPHQTRLQRLEDRGLPRQQAESRISAQADEPQRRQVADVWLDNGGTRAHLQAQVDALHRDRLAVYADRLRSGELPPRAELVLSPAAPEWAGQGERLVARLRHLAPGADRIEHIGSTAVPGLEAKDVIDLQVEVPTWDDVEALGPTLGAAGFPRRNDVEGDPPRSEVDPDPSAWRKRLHRGVDPGRPAQVHVRVSDSGGARLAVAFRDRLRDDPVARDRYAALKRELIVRYAGDVDGYAEAKTSFVLAAVDQAGGATRGS